MNADFQRSMTLIDEIAAQRDEAKARVRFLEEEVRDLLKDSCLCSQTQRDIAGLKHALACKCNGAGTCIECFSREKHLYEAREAVREYRVAKDGE